ncbi:MAG: radical SAM protein, partial [Spirochaetales bacterium]
AEMVDSFFSYIDNEFKYKKKYLTLFGGEPLLPGELYRERLGRIIRAAAERKLELAVVTNGFYLSEYLDLLTEAEIREIQVTLDGPAEIHDIRRPLKSGGGTFGTIVKGVDESLARGLTVNLRVVADSENIPRLHELADFAAARGWSGNPLFKTQVGRNYELHTCQMNRKPLLDRLGFGRALYREMTEHPALLDFFRPSFALAKHLHEQGKLPEPLFDGCPGCKTEWAFDCSGSIFSCTATVGKEGEALGRFHPDVYREETAIAAWTERDVLSIPECGSCDVQLACGGGCGAVAKNNSGRLHSPDCRPVKELMGLGLSLYFEKELQAEEEPICPD